MCVVVVGMRSAGRTPGFVHPLAIYDAPSLDARMQVRSQTEHAVANGRYTRFYFVQRLRVAEHRRGELAKGADGMLLLLGESRSQ